MIDLYWYPIVDEASNDRRWAMVNRPKKEGEYISAEMLLGYTERIIDGSWVCFVMRERHMECIGGEPSAQEAKKKIRYYYLGRLARGDI
jgi:hypothetical protein